MPQTSRANAARYLAKRQWLKQLLGSLGRSGSAGSSPAKRFRSRRLLGAETLESRQLLAAELGMHEHGPAGVDVSEGMFTWEEFLALEAIPFDSALSTKTTPEGGSNSPGLGGESSDGGFFPFADGSSATDVLTFVLDFKEPGQGNTSDIFGNIITEFEFDDFGFSAADFTTLTSAILAETEEDYFDELVGTVAGPTGRDLEIDFIIGDIGTAPVGLSEYYFIQIGTGISGPHSGGTLGVAGGEVVRDEFGAGPNSGIAIGDVVGSVFTDAINTIGGLSPSNALTSANLVATTNAISGTLSHEIAHTLSLSHVNRTNSVQPTAGASPLMGTGAIDLPNGQRITDREFSLSGFNAQNGQAPVQHVAQLVDAIGLRNTSAGSISGVKFSDDNANGVMDADELGISGATIYVDANGNSQLDAGEPSDVTAADGSYTISGILSTTVVVREVVATGFEQTTPQSQPAPDVVITEFSEQAPDLFEIQNVAGEIVDTSGWFLAASLGNDGNGNINNVHPDTFSLPSQLGAGELLVTTDSSSQPNFWGSNLNYVTGNRNWVLLVDDAGTVRDSLFVGYSQAQIESFDITVGGFNLTATDLDWIGSGADTSTSDAQTHQRSGVSDNNGGSDFSANPSPSPGAANAGLTTPLVSASGSLLVEVFGGLDTGNINFGGLVEDDYDFGDAPAPYPTLRSVFGARHVGVGPTLGNSRDIDEDGSPAPNASGDDGTVADDEDGIRLVGRLLALSDAPSTATVEVTLQNADPTVNRLDAWLDFNRDGDWDDAGERIFDNFDLGTIDGIQNLTFTVPPFGPDVQTGSTIGRFRLSTTGIDSVLGLAINGEVEDHSFVIQSDTQWQPQGPFSATNGQTENLAPNGQVVGAIHTVAAHPTNADILYIGGTNGGVWRTDDATSTFPTWTPLTDSLPSQSIGALVLDSSDPTGQTVLAGTGRFSSFGRIGNDRVGVYRSTDGGQNWSILNDNLVGANISGIAANGNNIVVSVNVADSFTFGNIGIYRSTDGGVTFDQVSIGDGTATGLPGGASYDLVVDPGNPNIMYTSTVFSDIVGGVNGFYKSIDGGATWAKVSNAAIDALITNGTSNIEMAVGTANNVYAAVINFGNLDGLFRSGDGGATWVQMDTPSTNENGIDVGLNPRGGKGPGPGDNPTPQELAGGQGSIHFSILADPNDANIVYVGGDRQPRTNGDTGSFPNSIGAFDFTGRLFRGDALAPTGSQFVHLTHSSSLGAAGGGTASSSAPHADSREMVFDAAGNIIQVDDGGVYRRTSPQDNTGDWFGVIGNLQVTEAHDVAYDGLSNVSMTGNQDTGTTFQPSEGAATWVSLSTADGGDVVIDDQSLAATNQSIRYSSFQNLGAFRRTVWDASGALVSTSFPSLSGFGNDGVFRTPVELNAIDPNRLAIQGGSQTYETFNQGNSVVGLGDAGNGGITQNAVAYGGQKNGVDNADVLWVGSGSDVFVRTESGEALEQVGQDPTSGTIVDLAIDPDNWSSAFALDQNSLFWTLDTGQSWTDITGDLLSLASSFYSVRYVASDAADALIVGTNAGVFTSLVGQFDSWTTIESGLPNVLVYDLDYHAGDDVLVAGTLGRGVWTLDEVTSRLSAETSDVNITIDGSGSLLVTDLTGTFADDLTIESDTTENQFIISGSGQTLSTNIVGATGNGTSVVSIPFALVTGPDVIFDLQGGNDTLEIDFDAGDFSKSIDFSGETLVLVGNTAVSQTSYDLAGPDNGTITVGDNSVISFAGTETIESDLIKTTTTVEYSDTSQVIDVSLDGQFIASSTAGPNLDFVFLPSGALTIQGISAGLTTVRLAGISDLGEADLIVDADQIILDQFDAIAFGEAGIALTATRDIQVINNSFLAMEDGDLSIIANQGTTAATGDFSGVTIDNSAIETENGNILIRGRGGSDATTSSHRGVLLTGAAFIDSIGFGAGAGTITLEGQGGVGASNNSGVQLDTVGTGIFSNDGDVVITGVGGDSAGGLNHGVVVQQGTISSFGTGPDAATITINGVAGNGVNDNSGIVLNSGDTGVFSGDGDVLIIGQGNGSGGGNSGVLLDGGSIVESIGTGAEAANITINATGGGGSSNNVGFQIGDLSGSVLSQDGDVAISGTGGPTGTSHRGIDLRAGLIESSGVGNLSLVGVGGGTSAEGISLGDVRIHATFSGDTSLTATAAGGVPDILAETAGGLVLGSDTGVGSLSIVANRVELDNASSIEGIGPLNFLPRTPATSIGLGVGGGELNLNSVELGRIVNGFTLISIGDATLGTGDVIIDDATFTDDVSIFGGSVVVSALDAGTQAVTIDSGSITDGSISPTPDITAGQTRLDGSVNIGGSGTEVFDLSGNVVLGADQSTVFELGGTAGGQFDQIAAGGSVSIESGVSLSIGSLAGFVPSPGDSFTLVSRNGGSGTFLARPEGFIFSDFLGSGLDAQLSYTGGTGDDIVLDVLATPITITNVIAASSQWQPTFVSVVDSEGTGLGVSLPGGDQLRSLPWLTGIDRIFIQFSENVSSTFNASNVTLIGNPTSYTSTATFTFDEVTNVGTIALPTAITNDSLLIQVFETIAGTSGVGFDGEWTDEVSQTSGDGSIGGEFQFRFEVLAGDVTDDRTVNVTGDLLTVFAQNSLVPANLQEAYFDINADGSVNVTGDVLGVFARNADSLPSPPSPGSNPGSNPGGFSSSLSPLAVDALFNDDNELDGMDITLF